MVSVLKGFRPVPEETVAVTRAAFPLGTTWVWLRDRLEVLYAEARYTQVLSHRGRTAEAPWRLALVSIMQFAEGLSDQEAADAVRARIDWKYALGLPLDDAGFDASVLRTFRVRLLTGLADDEVGSTLLAICHRQGWLPATVGAATMVVKGVRPTSALDAERKLHWWPGSARPWQP